jgi:hypothetical protein
MVDRTFGSARARATSARRWFLLALATLLCVLSCSSNSDDDDVAHSQSRLLDASCEAGGCSVTGSARQTTGITQDAVGFQVGPEPGTVQVELLGSPTASGYETSALSVLVSGQGVVVANGTTIYLDSTPRWRDATSPSASSSPPTLSLSVPLGSELELYDVRITSYRGIGCD